MSKLIVCICCKVDTLCDYCAIILCFSLVVSIFAQRTCYMFDTRIMENTGTEILSPDFISANLFEKKNQSKFQMAFKLLTNPDARRFMCEARGYACRVFASRRALEVTCVRVCRAV